MEEPGGLDSEGRTLLLSQLYGLIVASLIFSDLAICSLGQKMAVRPGRNEGGESRILSAQVVHGPA